MPASEPRTEPLNRPDISSAPDPETVVAIATAIHLHLASSKSSRDTIDAKRTGPNSWGQCGRIEIQNARSQTFLRPVNSKKHF